MKIKDLKELIKDFPENMEVVITGPDHSFYRCHAYLFDAFKDWLMYYEPDEGQPTEKVLVFE